MPDASAPAATAARAVLGALVRTVLKIIGTVLVTHGLIDQGNVDSTLSDLTQAIVGAVIVSSAGCWAVFRAWASHTRWARSWAALRARAD